MRLKKLLYIFIVAAGFIAILHFVVPKKIDGEGPYAVSHRGAAAIAPENTLSGVKAGVKSGAPFIEVDVRMTKDGVLVLMHDSTIDRTTGGSGKLSSLTWSDINTLDAGAWFGEEFTNEPIPRLDTVLEYMKGKPSTLVIEVKSPGSYPRIETNLTASLRHYGMESDVVIISFDTQWIKRAARLMPEASFGVLYIYPFSLPSDKKIEYVSVFWPALVLDPTLVWRIKLGGFKVWAWNVDSRLVAKFLTWKGVQGLTLDRPYLLKTSE